MFEIKTLIFVIRKRVKNCEIWSKMINKKEKDKKPNKSISKEFVIKYYTVGTIPVQISKS